HGLLALAAGRRVATGERGPCRRLRQQTGKRLIAQRAIFDNQSIRTAEGGEERGYDAGKKITGRKRHLAVDTLGLSWAVVVHGAYGQNYDGVCFIFRTDRVGTFAGGVRRQRLRP